MMVSIENLITIIFYALVISLIIIYRKKFEFQGKIIALRRFKFGISWMEKFSKKHAETIKILGYIGIGVGFAGMIFMIYTLVDAFITMFLISDAPAAVAPLVPGVKIPGSPLDIPLWVIIPLFVVVVIHEAGHGLVAKAHKIPIINTGIAFFGPIAGAFVEPDEKKLQKAPDVVKYSVFAAGPFSNALTALVVFLLMMFVLTPLGNSMTTAVGFTVSEVQEGLPAEIAGLEADTVYTSVNGRAIDDVEVLIEELSYVRPGETVTISDGETDYAIQTTQHPENARRAYIGVLGIKPEFAVNDGVPKLLHWVVQGLSLFFFWIFLLSIGLGAFNLLPLGPVDGGQMAKLALTRTQGEKKGISYWAKISMALLFIIILLLVIPIFRAVVA